MPPFFQRGTKGSPITRSRQAKGRLTFLRYAVGPCGSSRWPDVFHGWLSSLFDLALPYLATRLLLEVRVVQTGNPLMYHARAGVGRRLERIPPNQGAITVLEPGDLATGGRQTTVRQTLVGASRQNGRARDNEYPLDGRAARHVPWPGHRLPAVRPSPAPV